MLLNSPILTRKWVDITMLHQFDLKKRDRLWKLCLLISNRETQKKNHRMKSALQKTQDYRLSLLQAVEVIMQNVNCEDCNHLDVFLSGLENLADKYEDGEIIAKVFEED